MFRAEMIHISGRAVLMLAAENFDKQQHASRPHTTNLAVEEKGWRRRRSRRARRMQGSRNPLCYGTAPSREGMFGQLGSGAPATPV